MSLSSTLLAAMEMVAGVLGVPTALVVIKEITELSIRGCVDGPGDFLRRPSGGLSLATSTPFGLGGPTLRLIESPPLWLGLRKRWRLNRHIEDGLSCAVVSNVSG